MKPKVSTTEALILALRARVRDSLCWTAADEIEKYVKAWNAVSDKYEALLNQLGATDA